jgi:two-component system OmpR family sensor kinase
VIDPIDVPAYLEAALAGLSDVTRVELALGGLLAAARGLLDAESAYLLRLEAGHLVLAASDALPQPAVREVNVVGAGPEGRAAATGRLIIDRATGSAFVPRPDLALAASPIVRRGQVVGVLVATRSSLFVPSEVRWLRILGQIAGVTMENAQLIQNERRRARYAETVGALASIERVEVGPFCQRMAEVIRDVMNADRTDVLLHRSAVPLESGQSVPAGAERDELVRLGVAGEAADDDLVTLELSSGGPLAAAYSAGVPYRRGDVLNNPKAPALFRQLGMRSVLAVPIPGDVLPQGLLVVSSHRPSAFVDDDASFVRLVAERVGLLLRHAQIEREQARTAARQEFLTVVSHELKTPVAVIKAYGEVLARRGELAEWPPQDRRVVQRIREQADRMLAMIEQLLDLRRIESGVLSLELGRFDLAAMVRRAAEVIQATTDRHRLVVDTPPELAVRADRRRVEEVITNLLENAVKYSPAGGRIAVALCAEGGTAHLAIADEGIGIPPQELDRIFARFYQVGAGTYDKGHLGLGLGLYIAREIVESHGGRIWAESEPNRGATFHVLLPVDGPPD